MSASTQEIANLKSRVHNLEIALHGMWAMLRDLQPPATQIDMDRMMTRHFESSREVGGFVDPDFDG